MCWSTGVISWNSLYQNGAETLKINLKKDAKHITCLPVYNITEMNCANSKQNSQVRYENDSRISVTPIDAP